MRAVDLFAGWGGFTEGAEQAGVDVVWAANHWQLAVDAHAINHPNVDHACQDLVQADWTKLPSYELLLASPCCQGYSNASQPQRRAYHDAMRATAWAVIDCAEVTQPETILVENVPQFAKWQLFPLWMDALRVLGYEAKCHKLRASHYGVPQRRDRLFICASRVGAHITPVTSAPEPAMGPLIDWDAGQWRPITSTTPAAQGRIAKGRANHGERFLSQHVTGHPGVALHEPMRTITTKDQWIVVDGPNYRPFTTREYARGMSFPDTYTWPASANKKETVKGLGNAVCPTQAAVLIKEVA
jgi:DNA (cytosine-5)-methyltransferase 1